MTEVSTPPPESGKCKRGHAGPVGLQCGECLMGHVELVTFEREVIA